MNVTCYVDQQEVDCETWEISHKKQLLKLLKEKAYRKGEFKLSSGKTSEHYVN